MTIALGILAQNSIVLAADTELGVDYLKTDLGKISFTQQSSTAVGRIAALAITGSGNASYLAHLRREFTGWLSIDRPAPSVEELYQHATEYIAKFYADHVLPFSSYGNDLRPDPQIILAYSTKQNAALWRTEHNLLTEQSNYAVVGAGEMYARLLLNKFFMPMWPMNRRTATLLAAYVVYHVKKSIPGCGMDTDVVCLAEAGATFVDRDELAEMEELFKDCSRVDAGVLAHILVDSNDLSFTPVSREVRKLRARAKKFILSEQAD